MNDQAEQEIRAFAGPRADYYLEKWRLALARTGNATGFNWAAFFLSGLWLPYRKMYRATMVLYGIILLEIMLEEIVYVGILGKPEAPGILGSFVGLLAAIVCGGFGNAWYVSHAQKTIAEVRSQGLAEDAYFQALAKRGGTSAAAALGFLTVLFFAAVAIALLSELSLKRA
jgi:hypothetical protein